MVEKKVVNKLKEIVLEYNLGYLEDVKLLNSSQNKVYKAATSKGIFVVKEFSKDAIGNYYSLGKRKEQILVSKKFNDNGVKTIQPVLHHRKAFFLFDKRYYIIYSYVNARPLEEEQLTLNHIKKLAQTQSKIHKLKLRSKLPCSYKYISIDFKKYLKQTKKTNKKLYDTIKENEDVLNEMIKKCNKYLKNMKKNLCISHNDYKLLNILWQDDEMFLVDFDATGLANPTCALCESAYTFSKSKEGFNFKFYEEYLKTYIENYGKINDDFKEALYVCLNGKLQWLSYIISKSNVKKDNRALETIDMIKSLVLYYKNIDNFYNIYLLL